jgi:type II secretory ATPase GspE/PulE/Tfp pilus assembly ATPase PilB-like protein/ActR/RegA family two-component response regulator
MTVRHWIQRAAKREGLKGADDIRILAHASVTDAWEETMRACGVDAPTLAAALARSFRTQVADFSLAEPTATKLLPASVARRYQVFPLRDADRALVVATADPTNIQAEKEVGFASGRTPHVQIAPPPAIYSAIEASYSPDRVAEALLQGVSESVDHLIEVVGVSDEPEEITAEESATGPVVRLTNLILLEAIERGASDIHIQPMANGGVVRYRVDGVLRNGMQMPPPVLTRVVSRIKVMSRLDIADRLRPQDGRARMVVEGEAYDLRISTVPTRRAEKVVVRVLSTTQTHALEDTNIHAQEVERLRQVLSNRDGIFVVTGPTGSGKTTTMYAALREIATEDVNIMTVEDPIEYDLPGLTQIQVEPKQGVTFASALRAILRQDPDVVFVGEIRDQETAETAAQASLTGHLVLATLHTNDAVGAIRRFTDLGLDNATVADTLRAGFAQRLLRRVCRACAQPMRGPLSAVEEFLSGRYGIQPTVRAIGCEECHHQGYRGRLPVVELFLSSLTVQRMILDGAPMRAIREQVRSEGMRTLLEAALQRVRDGETTLEEVARVVGDEGDGSLRSVPLTEIPEADPRTLLPPSRAATAPTQTIRAVPAPDIREDADEAAPHVLVVDDDGASRAIARGLLEREGYRVSEAADGSEGLVLLARGETFDLMVLDLDMPTLGGRETLRAVRGSVSTAGLPIVVLTGTRDPRAEIELMEQGADDYIHKPIDPPRFVTRVKATLRRAGG